MISVSVTPQFKRMFKKLEISLQNEVMGKIEDFTNISNHKSLRIHKLNGVLKNRYGFSVNYKTRIVFTYESKEKVILTAIGSHDIYK